MNKNFLTKSLEQLENEYWDNLDEFPTNLVENCYKYRKIPLKDLSIEQLRLLISQKIGLEYLIEIAIEQLKQNILSEGNCYEGDLLIAVSNVSKDFWDKNMNELSKLKEIVKQNSELIKTELGEKDFERIYQKLY